MRKFGFLAILLCALMLTAMLSATALAAGETTYTFTSANLMSGLNERVYFKGDTIVFTPDPPQAFTGSNQSQELFAGVCFGDLDQVSDVTAGICTVNEYAIDGSGCMQSFTITSDNPVAIICRETGPTGVVTSAPNNCAYVYRYFKLVFDIHDTSYPINYELGVHYQIKGEWPTDVTPPACLALDGNTRSYELRVPTPVAIGGNGYFDCWFVTENVHVLDIPPYGTTGGTFVVRPVNGISYVPVRVSALTAVGGGSMANPGNPVTGRFFTLEACWSSAPVTDQPKTLTVVNGTGSGSYLPYAAIPVTANAPPAGSVFDQWVITDNGGRPYDSHFGVIDDPNSPSTLFRAASNLTFNGGVITATYKNAPANTVATPTFDPEAGEYHNAQMVTISCDTEGATIRYTMDGSEPDETSNTLYTGMHIPVTETVTIKAKAFKDGMTASDIATASYTITAPPPGTDIEFVSAIAHGSPEETTTKVMLTFDAAVDGIGIDDIALIDTDITGATADALLPTDEPNVYELTLTGVAFSGSINIDVCKDGFDFTPTNMDVTVYCSTPPPTTAEYSLALFDGGFGRLRVLAAGPESFTVIVARYDGGRMTAVKVVEVDGESVENVIVDLPGFGNDCRAFALGADYAPLLASVEPR